MFWNNKSKDYSTFDDDFQLAMLKRRNEAARRQLNDWTSPLPLPFDDRFVPKVVSNTTKPVQQKVSQFEGMSEVEIETLLHNEFDTAPERLLENAKKLLDAIGETERLAIEKGQRLKKLGFTNAKGVAESDKKVIENDKAKSDAEDVIYYKQKYPFAKFLTVSELERICNKYSLIYAPAHCYIKDVPDKNLKEIENAQDIFIDDISPKYFRWSGPSLFTAVIESIKTKHPDVKTAKDIDNFTVFSITNGQGGLIDAFKGFQIAAPSDHFSVLQLTAYKKTNNGYSELPTPILTKDPIVFKYVRNGCLIFAKWGSEANDPALVNPIEN